MNNPEYLAIQNIYIQPYLLKNRADLTYKNLQEICTDSINQLTASLQKCDNLVFANRQTGSVLRRQITNEIENLKQATKQQKAETLKSIMQEAHTDVLNVAKQKKACEFLLKFTDNKSSIVNDLVGQKQRIEQTTNYAINYVKAQLKMYTYSEEEKLELTKLLTSYNRIFKKIQSTYAEYNQVIKAEDEESKLAGV